MRFSLLYALAALTATSMANAQTQSFEFGPYFEKSPEREVGNLALQTCVQVTENHMDQIRRVHGKFLLHGRPVSEAEYRSSALEVCLHYLLQAPPGITQSKS